MTSAANKKIKAAIFDFDGMIFDTRELMFQTYSHALTAHGYPAPKREDIYAAIGKQVHESYLHLIPDIDAEAVVKTHRTFQDKNIHLISSYKNLEQTLEKLKRAGIKMAVFTSRGPNSTNGALKLTGVIDYFETVVTADDVKHHKPHPEGLLKALEILKVMPENAAILGDSVYDIEAGKAAGVVLTVAITHGFGTREDLEKAKPDYIVKHLAEIPPLLIGKMSSNDPD